MRFVDKITRTIYAAIISLELPRKPMRMSHIARQLHVALTQLSHVAAALPTVIDLFRTLHRAIRIVWTTYTALVALYFRVPLYLLYSHRIYLPFSLSVEIAI